MVDKLYRCPHCGEVLTEEEYLRNCESGSSGYCLCEFSATDEKGDVWFPRIYHEYEVYVLQKKTTLEEAKP